MTAHPELLVLLANLPGLDATGLPLRSRLSGAVYVCIGFRPRVHCWYGVPLMGDERTAEDCQWVPLGAVDAMLDVGDAPTRDRLARFCAHKDGLRTESTAPRWYWSGHDECWWLDVPSIDSRGYSHLGKVSRDGHRLLEGVSALAEVDPYDDTRITDGALLSDCLALKAAALHLAGGGR